MARGRKPKPIEVREAEGNQSRRPLPDALRTGANLSTVPPRILGEEGAALWVELTTRLGEVGALDQIDRAALTAMCLQWDRACDAGLMVREQGHVARGSQGQPVAHPALAIERAAHLAFLKFASEYAATPVARARVATARQAQASQAELESFTEAEPIEIDAIEELDDDGEG